MEITMKIEQLLEYPASIGGPLASAKAREAGKTLTDFGSVGAKRAAGQGTMPATSASNLKVVPGGKSVSGTASSAPTVAPKTALVAAPKTSSTLDKARKFGQQVADVGGALSRGAQTVAKGTGSLVKGVGQGIGSALSGVGSVAKGVGDVAAQTVGGVAQTAGAAIGGVKHGIGAAGAGQKFGGGGYAGTPTSTPATPATSAGGDEVDSLKAALQAMDSRLRKAGI